MLKFTLAKAAILTGRPFPPEAAAKAHEARHATTRTRDATRRLRALHIHDPYIDLSSLDITRRH
jgi:hypothetical protein